MAHSSNNLNAEHASPAASLVILAGIVAIVLFGGWLFANHEFRKPVVANQVLAPAPSTTGAGSAR